MDAQVATAKSSSQPPSGLGSTTAIGREIEALAAAAQRDCADVERVVPGGIAPPAGIRTIALYGALREFDELRRLDMGVLAQNLGVSRSTLYRQSGDRDSLLGQAIWWRARMVYSLVLNETKALAGLERLVATIGIVVRHYHRTPALRRFVEQEPQAAMRILTGPRGHVRSGILELTRRLLELEIEKGDLVCSLESEMLADAVVRLCESFMYTDVLALGEPDLDLGLHVVNGLLTGSLRPRSRT